MQRMSILSGPAGRGAWIGAAIALVVAAVLAVALFALVYPARADSRASAGTRVLSSEERSAMRAASVQMVNLLSYSRKDFDADYTRALAGTTGQLHDDLAKDRASTLAQLNQNKFDTKGTVTDVALESGGNPKTGLLVLVLAEGYQVDDSGQKGLGLPQRVELTMVEKDGKWLASDLTAVSLV